MRKILKTIYWKLSFEKRVGSFENFRAVLSSKQVHKKVLRNLWTYGNIFRNWSQEMFLLWPFITTKAQIAKTTIFQAGVEYFCLKEVSYGNPSTVKVYSSSTPFSLKLNNIRWEFHTEHSTFLKEILHTSTSKRKSNSNYISKFPYHQLISISSSASGVMTLCN